MAKNHRTTPLPREQEIHLCRALEAMLRQGPPWKAHDILPLLSYPHVDVRLLAYSLVIQANPNTLTHFEQALRDRSRRIPGFALGRLLTKWSLDRERLLSEYFHNTNKHPLGIGDGPVDPQYVDLLDNWLFGTELPQPLVSHIVSLIVSTGVLSRQRLRDYIWHEHYTVRVPAIKAAVGLYSDISADLREGLNHSNASVVLSCIYGLAEVADERDVETFIEFTSHPEGRFQRVAITALGNLHSPRARTFLHSLTVDMIRDFSEYD